MIPMNECKNGYLYKLNGRNLISGIYDEKSKAFIGIREKWGEYYLDTEWHWDNQTSLSAAKPTECLNIIYEGELSEKNKELFDFLMKN